uniref:RBR-type E3 ubiquitin transferase n=1 Tax=Panagrolaimus sp. PS1159 TaxID=55785 RepID=A0AC35FNN9_9BILA
MPGIDYSLNKAQYWDIFKSPVEAIDKLTPYFNEYSVAFVKGQKLQNGGTFKSFALKQPNQEIKFIETKSGNGSSFMGLHNELVELEPRRRGEKRQKYSGLQNFRETPSIVFVVEERHPSDYVYEASVYRYKNSKMTRKEFYLKINSIDKYENEGEEIYDENFDEPSVSHETNLTFGDCFIKKSFQNNCRRKNVKNSFKGITFDDPAIDKIKKTPKVVFNSFLAKENMESMVFSYNKNSISSLNFESIDFMYDLLWLNDEKTKCLFIIPKNINIEKSNFDSFMILEFFGGKRKRLR